MRHGALVTVKNKEYLPFLHLSNGFFLSDFVAPFYSTLLKYMLCYKCNIFLVAVLLSLLVKCVVLFLT